MKVSQAISMKLTYFDHDTDTELAGMLNNLSNIVHAVPLVHGIRTVERKLKSDNMMS